MGQTARKMSLREQMQLKKRNTLVRYATAYGVTDAYRMTKDELVDILIVGVNQGVERRILETNE